MWKFLLRGVLTFVASGLDSNGCVDSKCTLLYKLLYIVAKCHLFTHEKV